MEYAFKHRQIFEERGPENGVDRETAGKIFDDIEFFARYGFNKCLAGSTQIMDAQTGELVCLRDIYDGTTHVRKTLSVDTEAWRIQVDDIVDVIYNGIKPVFRLTTATGRQITATANHPFYAMNGWQFLGDLKPGDYVAVARYIPYEDITRRTGAVPHKYRSVNLSNLSYGAAFAPEDVSQAAVQPHTDYSGCSITDSDDLFWDRIVSIEQRGEEPTFDLTIADNHNFIANDMLVHNSHAADYAVITCQTAFLKCHYPEEYMTALMSVYFDDSARVSLFIADCRRMGIEILHPDVNFSQADFSIEANQNSKPGIRFGMGAIKNVGSASIQYIIEKRGDKPFYDLDDFLKRCDMREVGKRALESLIRVGALHGLYEDRTVLLANLDKLITFSTEHHRNASIGQMSMFELMAAAPGEEQVGSVFSTMIDQPLSAWDHREQLRWEKELVGLYVSEHPLQLVWSHVIHTITHTTADLKEEGELAKGKFVCVAGLVNAIRSITTKKGDPMAILTVEDIQGSIEVVLFPNTWADFRNILEVDRVYLFRGKGDVRGTDSQILVYSVQQDFRYASAAEPLPERNAPVFEAEIDEETGEVVRTSPVPEPPPLEPIIAPATDGASTTHRRFETQLTASAPESPPADKQRNTSNVDGVPEFLEEPPEFQEAYTVMSHLDDKDSVPLDDYSDFASEYYDAGKRTGHLGDRNLKNPAPHVDKKYDRESLIDQRTQKLIPPEAPADIPQILQQKKRRLIIEMRRTFDDQQDRRRLRMIHGMAIAYPGNDEFCVIFLNNDGRRIMMRFTAPGIKIHDDVIKDLQNITGVAKVYIEDEDGAG